MNANRRTVLLALLLAAATLLAYSPALHGNFIWDDDRHVSENHTLLDLQGLDRIWLHPSYLPQWYPMTHTSFWIEYHLWGLSTLGYHLDNVLLHIINALLFWQLLKRLKIPGAAVAAAIFALHPIEVESVAWISERKNLLSTFFALLSIHAFLRSKKDLGFVFSFLLFAAAMLSKTVACSVPAVILVLIWWEHGKVDGKTILRLTPFFLLGVALAIFTAHTEVSYVHAQGPDWDLSPVQRSLIAGRAVWFYAAKLFWPMRLTFSYPRWNVDQLSPFFAMAALALVLALTLLSRRIGRGPLVAIVLFIGILVPALGFLNTYPMRYSFVADHFQYVAGMALISLASAIIAKYTDEQIAIVPIGIVLLVLTFMQSRIYAGPENIWRDVIAKNDSSWLARQSLGVLLKRTGDPVKLDEAEKLFEQVYALRPQHDKLQANWADTLFQLGRWEDSLPHYQAALELPGVSKTLAHDRMGVALGHLGRFPEAEAEYRTALALSPDTVNVHADLADLLATEKRDAEAQAEYEQIRSLDPDNEIAHERLGQFYLKAGRAAEAVKEFSAAVRLAPDSATAAKGLADALMAASPKLP